jgi:uncharacterized protein
MKRPLDLALLALLALTPGCGPAAAVATPPPTGPAQVGPSPQTCSLSPNVIQLKADERADIEMAMKSDVAVVSYNCKDLRLLKSCMALGRYDFVGTARRDVDLRLKSRVEAEAAVPFSGTRLPLREQAEILELKLVTVGTLRATVQRVGARELNGACDGATHFIHGAAVGAFLLSRESTAGDHQRNAMSRDGELDACQAAAPTSTHPPTQCRSLIQLDLTPIGP